MIRLGCLLDESTDMEAVAAAENLAWAWRQWAMYCCEERGGHDWILHGEHPDECPDVSLHCDVCGASVEDLAGWDGTETIVGQLGDITVGGGIHNHHDEFDIPVRVDVRVEQYTSMNSLSPEYDVYVDVEPA